MKLRVLWGGPPQSSDTWYPRTTYLRRGVPEWWNKHYGFRVIVIKEKGMEPYSYDTCVQYGLVPKKPLAFATGAELNQLIQLLVNRPGMAHEDGTTSWSYYDDSRVVLNLAELRFDADKVYDLFELGSFEWDGQCWDEPILFVYNKWKHTGDPTPPFGFFVVEYSRATPNRSETQT